MLKTKSILEQKEDLDGLRISIMSRHTLNDGKTPHPDIHPDSYDSWLPVLAPPARLIGSYYKRDLSWDKFEKEYLEYIMQPEVQIEIQNIIVRSMNSTTTILCIEDSPEYCHRRLLAEECRKLEPNLELNIE